MRIDVFSAKLHDLSFVGLPLRGRGLSCTFMKRGLQTVCILLYLTQN